MFTVNMVKICMLLDSIRCPLQIVPWFEFGIQAAIVVISNMMNTNQNVSNTLKTLTIEDFPCTAIHMTAS